MILTPTENHSMGGATAESHGVSRAMLSCGLVATTVSPEGKSSKFRLIIKEDYS